jgi:DNA-binding NarL/FixJ family response regulator
MVPLRVVPAEDDVLLREGLASLLERSGFVVVGQTDDGSQLLPLVRDMAPELVAVDIRMPPTHTTEGLQAERNIRTELPETGILVVSANAEVEHAMGHHMLVMLVADALWNCAPQRQCRAALRC